VSLVPRYWRTYTYKFIVHGCMYIYSVATATSSRVTVYISLSILHVYSYKLHWIGARNFRGSILNYLLAFQKFNMDPRRFGAPIQCNSCDLLLYTLRDVSEHCSRHDHIDFICHHCLTHFDSKGAIAAHMNQKGACLRQSFDMGAPYKLSDYHTR